MAGFAIERKEILCYHRTVKVYEIDNQGRINLTMKDLEAGNKEE